MWNVCHRGGIVELWDANCNTAPLHTFRENPTPTVALQTLHTKDRYDKIWVWPIVLFLVFMFSLFS